MPLPTYLRAVARSWPPRLPRNAEPWLDGVIAVGVFVATALPVLLSRDGQWWHLVAAAGASLPLFWRRRNPLLTTAIVGAAISVLGLAHQLPPLPFGSLVATYTFALISPSPWRQIAIGVQSVAVVVSLIVPGEDWATFGYVGMAYVAAYSLGIGTRGRRDRIAMLEERSARHEEERAAAAVRDRNRIAREVHDIVAHTVAVMVVQAEAGPVMTRNDPERAEKTFEVIAESGRTAIAQLRRSLAALRSAEGEVSARPGPGLADVPGVLDDARRSGLVVTLRRRGRERPLASEADATVYRVVQESLTNTIRHAHASKVDVLIEFTEDDLRLTITDDGTGATDVKSGYGMMGMRERVTACGGEVYAGSDPAGAGFVVSAVLPTE
ncbi:sensor histidine kinase [Actinoplanes bogorensis]|uniref:histidine kinase n=1 Tax=Paractinoplanes bogorensis TaxID=1610840 RepID=A0ABS5YR13_9ACTN|nr:sensor histidine kinase [Actinoplanes bogorensis]MBU2665891.1 sensor histidine kinase [Actinoplanes bogorensis]